MKSEAELKMIAEQTVVQMRANFPDTRCLVITLNELTGPTPVVIKGNIKNVEATVRILRGLADELEKHGLVMLA